MISLPYFLRWLTGLGLLALVWGCTPGAGGAVDEEKEPQFFIGRSRVNAMNFRGAIEAFEQALEMNPRSAAAHFELGWLYAEKEADPAAAIYHYQRYLQLRPQAGNAETIRQHILRLKQELAKAVMPIPPSSDILRQLEQALDEKRQLQGEVDRLQRLLVQPASAGTRAEPRLPVIAVSRTNALASGGRTAPLAVRSANANPDGGRAYRVREGDTLVAIARRHGVKLENLLAANPRLDPRRIQPGQSVLIPRP